MDFLDALSAAAKTLNLGTISNFKDLDLWLQNHTEKEARDLIVLAVNTTLSSRRKRPSNPNADTE